ncbi:MAG: hypothetical protein BWY92_00637 [Firmicutes bacterium ADurb.BinA052]|nr:MAG: hypothetical protein BWY92_00637 [Firmicutes bacterium ADurb.BinA052]
MALALVIQFSQVSLDVVGEFRDASGCRPVGEHRIHPEGAKHFHEVGLSGAIETADPHGGLRGLIRVSQEGVEDVFEPLVILAIAHECLELVAQYVESFRGCQIVVDAGNALVHELSC